MFDRLVNQVGLPIDPDELWRDYRSRMLMLVAVADEDRAARVALRAAGWTLGIVTNGTADNQEGKNGPT